MNANDVRLMELALKKQQLVFASEQLRGRLRDHGRALPAVCDGIDRARAAGRWLKARPAIPVAIGVALLVGRPRVVWRWSRRAFRAWQVWRRARNAIDLVLAYRR
jgi:hypothetical protein